MRRGQQRPTHNGTGSSLDQTESCLLPPVSRLVFSTWPPETFVGRLFALTGRYAPPPPAGASPPAQWGDPNVVRERLGNTVTDVVFDRAVMLVPALSVQHQRVAIERSPGEARRITPGER